MTNSWDALPDAPVAATQPQKNPKSNKKMVFF